jgi:hypothetical protein
MARPPVLLPFFLGLVVAGALIIHWQSALVDVTAAGNFAGASTTEARLSSLCRRGLGGRTVQCPSAYVYFFFPEPIVGCHAVVF